MASVMLVFRQYYMIFKEDNMDKTIGYIFGRLEIDEIAIGNIVSKLKKQMSFNKSVTFFAMACTVYMIVADVMRKEDLKKIEALTKEVEELKETKGE